MKKISILGSTGSIGSQTIEIIEANPDKYQLIAASCHKNIAMLAQQIKKFHLKYVAVYDEASALQLKKEFPHVEIYSGMEGLIRISSEIHCDLVVNALVGMIGLTPTYYAILQGIDIALANKETLVAGGAIVMDSARKKDVMILPVDSEHSAIFQCLEGNQLRPVSRIILTASGGPFRGKTLKELTNVTVQDALNHPNWSMGQKITIDSATMMNKGLEVIEASWLFDMPADKIDVVIHPQSIIHSMVEYSDHAVLAQLGTPDMKIPISLALAYPDRLPNDMAPLDLVAAGNLSFEKPDLRTFKCLKLAYDALKQGSSYCIAINGANEVLVDEFLKGKIPFTNIPDCIERVLHKHRPQRAMELEEILEIDRVSRQIAREELAQLK